MKPDLLLEVLEESLRRTNEQFRKAMERKWALHDDLRKLDAEIRRLEDRRTFFSEAVRRLKNDNRRRCGQHQRRQVVTHHGRDR